MSPVLTVGARVRRERLAAGMSRNELARRAGMSQIGVTYLERNERSPRFDTLSRVARVLGLSLDDLATVENVDT